VILPAIGGALIVLIVLWEAFETVVLPRRVARRFRLTVLYYRSTWRAWRTIADMVRKAGRRESFLSFFGPLSLLFLFVFWAFAIICGFALLYRSAAIAASIQEPFETALYLSGTTMFTLGLGDVVPHSTPQRILAVVESGLGFGFLALVLSYLPVIYQAFSRREVNIVLLDARAGSPPTAAELLRRHSGPNGEQNLQILLQDWERAAAEILESHVSYPVVCYFRSQHNNESWVGALTAILDVCALLIANKEDSCARQARLTFAICRHTMVDLAQVFYARPTTTTDRLPPGELQRLRALLADTEFRLRDSADSLAKLEKLRAMYEPYVNAMAARLEFDVPPWILSREIADNWKTSAWGRIAGLSQSQRSALSGAPSASETDAHAD
jgi:hypothetical protein